MSKSEVFYEGKPDELEDPDELDITSACRSLTTNTSDNENDDIEEYLNPRYPKT
jgi:hypothetical protein